MICVPSPNICEKRKIKAFAKMCKPAESLDEKHKHHDKVSSSLVISRKNNSLRLKAPDLVVQDVERQHWRKQHIEVQDYFDLNLQDLDIQDMDWMEVQNTNMQTFNFMSSKACRICYSWQKCNTIAKKVTFINYFYSTGCTKKKQGLL